MRVDGIRSAAARAGVVGVLLAGGSLTAPAAAQEWTAEEIVERAVARADQQRDERTDLLYRTTFESITEKLSGDGDVEDAERSTYEQYPLEGVIYEELVAREGEPLTADDERKERNAGGTSSRRCASEEPAGRTIPAPRTRTASS